MNELLLKLIELVGALKEIFRQIDIADRLTNARNGIRSSADKTFIVARISKGRNYLITYLPYYQDIVGNKVKGWISKRVF